MKRFFLDKFSLENKILQNEEFVHAITVLRMKEGDSFCAIIGDEFDYICKICSIGKHSASFEVVENKINKANPSRNITIFQALAKGDKMELLAQKLTEIGASSFVPVYTKNCDVKPNTHRVSRLDKISQGACKQCGRSIPLKISEVTKLDDILDSFKNFDILLFANEKEESLRIKTILSSTPTANNIGVIIGPEGGWDDSEIDKIVSAGAKSISLGSRILRTETAGLYITSILADFYEV